MPNNEHANKLRPAKHPCPGKICSVKQLTKGNTKTKHFIKSIVRTMFYAELFEPCCFFIARITSDKYITTSFKQWGVLFHFSLIQLQNFWRENDVISYKHSLAFSAGIQNRSFSVAFSIGTACPAEWKTCKFPCYLLITHIFQSFNPMEYCVFTFHIKRKGINTASHANSHLPVDPGVHQYMQIH